MSHLFEQAVNSGGGLVTLGLLLLAGVAGVFGFRS
jgi:hypothetical protein